MIAYCSPKDIESRVCVCRSGFGQKANKFRLKAGLQTAGRQKFASSLTMLITKIVRRLSAGIAALLLVLLSCSGASHGQELERVLAHVDGQTSMLVRIDAAAFDALVGSANSGDNEAEPTVLLLRLKQTRELLDGDPVWLTVGFPQTPLAIQILLRDPDGKRIEAVKQLWDFPNRPRFGEEPPVVIRELSDSVIPSSVAASRLEKWKKAMEAGPGKGGGMIRFAGLPPEHLYETYRESLTELPDYLGGGPVTLLTDGLQAVSGSFDLKTGALAGAIKSASPQAATSFAERANQMIALHTKSSAPNNITKRFAPLIQQLGRSIFRPVDETVRWDIPANSNWHSQKVLGLALGSEANRSAVKRLRNLALGVLNYESAHQHLPPSTDSRGADGPTGLSWRVHILPFLGESKLYKRFKLDEPWDSPANIKLLPEMPDVFNDYGSQLFAPADAKPGYTTVVAPINENTILGAPRKVTFAAITDGTSNTILLVNVKDSLAVPWTSPQDYVFDPDQPAAGLKFTDGKTPVVFCDGRERQLVKENDWMNLFEMNDGQVVQPRD